ncbi:histidine kinase [Nocardia sp.]|uniref:sensor histidine kinase n=1 Tax=Nocardia sp. TaxID=1821 RepID=UPI00258F2A13|nr:histidine kinase [Nocardia sp.]
MSTTRPRSAVADRIVRFGAAALDDNRRSWFGALIAVAWLSYLIGPIVRNWREGEHANAAWASVTLFAYAAVILGSFVVFRDTRRRDPLVDPPVDHRVWPVLAAMTLCTVVLVALLGAAALPTAIYISVVAIFHLPSRESGYVSVVVVLAMLLVPVALPDLRGVPFYVAFVPLVIWAARHLGLRGERLSELARRQKAELAIVAERNRVARDVHDILGHSLTVITVKTELAQRLLDVDIERARAELADVERLAREALGGVRDTVGGLREVTLRAELANAASALAAADIAADLPDPANLPDGDNELFGWVLREAVTNVVRHSAARHCTVIVTATSIDVIDDGRGLGPDAGTGSGLAGLRERTRAAGATMALSIPAGGGAHVAVTVPKQLAP